MKTKITSIYDPQGAWIGIGYNDVVDITEGEMPGHMAMLPTVIVHYKSGATLTYTQDRCGIKRTAWGE